MTLKLRYGLATAILIVLLSAAWGIAAGQKQPAGEEKKPDFEIAEDVGDSMFREAARVKDEFEKHARTLFARQPLGWGWGTINYLSRWLGELHLKFPVFVRQVMEQGRVLGAVGSLIVLTFIIAVLYSLLGQNRVLVRVEAAVQPISARIPQASYPHFISALKLVVAALIPLLLLGAFFLINALITYKAAWFQLTGRLLVLWAAGALLIGLLRESLTRDLFAATARYGKLKRVMSFPVVKLGETQVTCWIILKALFILLAFFYTSRLLQAYLDYRIYPSIGVDPGLGYALNTFFKYFSLIIGFIIALKIVGIDLRFLLVFAGAAGIGIGFGLQNMAANVISGFTIIFGGKIRKGDWIEAGNTLGVVTDIYLRATKVKTRDNIEYLIPNSDLISNTIINYSLSSPMIRIELPVGVSYNADPQKVKKVLLAAAEKEPMVEKYAPPEVRFKEYGDSSINFELLIWINVRKTARRNVRSALYFEIFEAFKKAGIEILFPQRDIHIRSRIGPESATT